MMFALYLKPFLSQKLDKKLNEIRYFVYFRYENLIRFQNEYLIYVAKLFRREFLFVYMSHRFEVLVLVKLFPILRICSR